MRHKYFLEFLEKEIKKPLPEIQLLTIDAFIY